MKRSIPGFMIGIIGFGAVLVQPRICYASPQYEVDLGSPWTPASIVSGGSDPLLFSSPTAARENPAALIGPHLISAVAGVWQDAWDIRYGVFGASVQLPRIGFGFTASRVDAGNMEWWDDDGIYQGEIGLSESLIEFGIGLGIGKGAVGISLGVQHLDYELISRTNRIARLGVTLNEGARIQLGMAGVVFSPGDDSFEQREAISIGMGYKWNQKLNMKLIVASSIRDTGIRPTCVLEYQPLSILRLSAGIALSSDRWNNDWRWSPLVLSTQVDIKPGYFSLSVLHDSIGSIRYMMSIGVTQFLK